MINDADKLLMYLFAICIFGKMSVRSFCSVSIRLFVCFWYCVVWAFYRFWILTPYQTYHLQIFPPIQQVVFSFCWWFLLLCRSFLVWCSPIYLFIYILNFFSLSEETNVKDIVKIDIKEHMLSPRNLIVSGLTSKSLIHFKLIFVYGVR